MDIVKHNMGWIEVIVGPMFSGKSEELIRRLRRAEIARQRVQIFKPAIDERYSATEIVSHSGLGIRSDNISKASEILEKIDPRTEVIGIDEGQFLGEPLVEEATRLANMGKRVIIAGLDTDYLGPSVRADADAACDCRRNYKVAGDLYALRKSRGAHATSRRFRRFNCGRRRWNVRSAMPPLFRCNSCAREIHAQ